MSKEAQANRQPAQARDCVKQTDQLGIRVVDAPETKPRPIPTNPRAKESRPMTYRRGFQPKTELTPLEKLKCADLYLRRGLSQETLSAIFAVHQNRINAAINDLFEAVGLPRVNYEDD